MGLSFVDGVGGSEGCSGGRSKAAARQYMLKRCKNGIDILAAGIVTHQTYTYQTAFELAEAAADFDTVFIEQAFANGQLVNAFRDSNGGQDGEGIARFGEELQTHGLDTWL